MSLSHKKPRPLVRDLEEKPLRDARLFVIATEDTCAPKQYFCIFHNLRTQVKVLPTQEGFSSPEHVLDRLVQFVSDFEMNTEEGDELWLMLDTDHWIEPNHIDNFRQVCREAINKSYQLAHSNPSFETWLLLHHVDLSPDEQFKNSTEVEQQLKKTLGQYNKRNIDCKRFSPDSVATAVQRAENLDTSPSDRWPQKTGTHVYRLVKKLLEN